MLAAMNRTLFGFVACVLVAAPLEAQNRPLSYDDYYRIERAGATALSPDGRRVAFVRSRVLEEENRHRQKRAKKHPARVMGHGHCAVPHRISENAGSSTRSEGYPNCSAGETPISGSGALNFSSPTSQ